MDGRSIRSSSARIVIVHHAVVYYRVSKDRALRASQLEARLAQTQLQMLRMQLQPHFLFNTLHSISALMHKDVRRADSMIAALSDLLRMSLQNIGAQEVPLQSELDFLQRYLEIMSLRFGDRLRVSIDIDPETRDARVPNLFLQPLVENSFRHGFGDLGAGRDRDLGAARRRHAALRRQSTTAAACAPATRKASGSGEHAPAARAPVRRPAHLLASRRARQGVHVTMAIPFHPYRT